MVLNNEIRLLAILSLADLKEADILKSKGLAKKINPAKLFELAKWHRVTPGAYSNITKYFPDLLGSELTSSLKTIYQKNCLHCRHQMITISELSEQFKKAKVKFQILKGIPLAQKLYGSPLKRQARDIDILISPTQLDLSLEIFHTLGYESKFNILDKQQRELYLETQKDITFVSNAGIVIELHLRLSGYQSTFSKAISRELLCDTKSIDREKLEFIYYCWHGAHSIFHRLKWLTDLAQFIRVNRWNQEEWRSTLLHAKQLGIERYVFLSLAILHQVFNTPFPFQQRALESTIIKTARFLVKSSLAIPEYYQSKQGKMYSHLIEILLFTKTSDKTKVLFYRFKPTVVDIVLHPHLPKPLVYLYGLCRPLRFIYRHIFLSSERIEKLVYNTEKKVSK